MSFQLQQLYTFPRQAGHVLALAWNPASEFDGVPVEIATGGIDCIVRIWEHIPGITDGFNCKQVLAAVLPDGRINTTSCVWSPDGKFLATTTMFDATIWENVWGRYELVDVLKGKNTLDPLISWNASGTLLATCGPGISIWKASSSEKFDVVSEPEVLHMHSVKIVQWIKWHPSKDILFSSGSDGAIKIWEENVDRGKWNCVQNIGEPSDSISLQLFTFNDSGDKIVVSWSCEFIIIKIWGSEIKKTETGEENTLWTCLCTLDGYHDQTISSIDWSRYKLLLKKVSSAGEDMVKVQWFSKGKSRRLATADYSGTVKIWELALSSQTV